MRLALGKSTPAIRAIGPHFVRNFKFQISNPSWFDLTSDLYDLSLALFVLGVLAQHAHHAFAPNDLALVANFLD
jgi:hypothetical protein